MRHQCLWPLLVLLTAGTTAVIAAESYLPYDTSPSPSEREGGEVIATARTIGSLPFADAGMTCNNVHDYDESCPFTGSTAADVVYRWVAPAPMPISIDLCASLFNTKVYVYDFEGGFGYGNPIACNDDAGCGYSGTQSVIDELWVTTEHTYFIVVDGFDHDACGQYFIYVHESPPCDVPCPPGAPLEGEPPLINNYEDSHNGGCNSVPPVFQTLAPPFHTPGRIDLCSRAGTYRHHGEPYRDTDWFICHADSAGLVTCSLTAQFPTVLYHLGFDPEERCEGGIEILDELEVEPCETGTLTLVTPPGEEIWLWAGCVFFEGIPEYSYLLHLEGIAPPHHPQAAPGPRTAATSLHAARPNPMTRSTRIGFALASTEQVLLEIFDVTGARVRCLRQGIERAGMHHASWDGRDDRGDPLPSGLYCVRMRAGRFAAERRITFLR